MGICIHVCIHVCLFGSYAGAGRTDDDGKSGV